MSLGFSQRTFEFFGNWVLLGAYTHYAPYGVTPVHSFMLDNVNNPTSRV